MRLALAQINTVVGDLAGNRARILERLEEARGEGADLVLFPELAVTGYPPEDLLLRPSFVRAAEESLDEIARECRGIAALVGVPHFDRDLYNACAVCVGGEVRALYRKRFLPNYGVFDEARYFAPGRDLLLLEHGDALLGPTICEDIWQPGPPATELSLAGAQLVTNISASPFHVGKERAREEMLKTRARDNACFIAFCNAVGGQDELIFDGHSVVLDDDGEVLARAPGFEECLLVVDVDPVGAVARRLRDVRRRTLGAEIDPGDVPVVHIGAPRDERAPAVTATIAPLEDELEQMRLALELGLGDYVRKNGFSDVVVGVSGGIDSALTAALAVEALGPEHVHCVSMPSRYSSSETQSDARRVAENLGADFLELPIAEVVDAFEATLTPVVRRPRPRPDGGEHPGAGARRPAHGAVEQVRLAARGDRQQVGALGRLRDALRRHGRRLRAAEGRVQDGRVPARPAPERAGRPRARAGVDHRARTVGRAARRSARRGLAAALCRPRPGAGGVRGARPLARRAARATASTRTWSSGRWRSSTGPSTSGARPRPGVKLRPKAFGRDRRVPITNRWPD